MTKRLFADISNKTCKFFFFINQRFYSGFAQSGLTEINNTLVSFKLYINYAAAGTFLRDGKSTLINFLYVGTHLIYENI